MKRQIRFFIEFLIILIALGAALFSQRVFITEWVENKMKAELPQAVAFEEVKKKAKEETKEETKVEVPSPAIPVVLSPSEGPLLDDTQRDPSSVEPPQDDTATLPASINLAVPFTPQAPRADWSLPYQEACEEASLYMVYAYYQKFSPGLISAESAEKELLQIIAFEQKLFGYYEDTTIEQVATLAESMYGYGNVEVIDDPTVEQIKTQLAEGRPVIVPAAGRLLQNPNFQQPGPVYHMLVIRGYTNKGQFITNDPGTRRGEAYLYDFDTLMNAIHDWNGGDDITQGKKRILIIYPET